MARDEVDQYDQNWESIEDLEEEEEDPEVWDDDESEWGRDTFFDEDGFECNFDNGEDDDFDYDESDYEEE